MMKFRLIAVMGIALSLGLGCQALAQTASLAADFAADCVNCGHPTLPGMPSNNPLPATGGGTWTFYAEGDTQGAPTVVAIDGDVGAGVGDGWDDPGHGIGGYGIGGAHGIGPGGGDAVVQHTIGGGSVSKVDYAVPATGLYDLGLNIQQPNFEPARANRMAVFLNDFAGAGTPIVFVDATLGGTGPAPGVDNSLSNVMLNMGDILTIAVSADGAGGDGVGTFVGFNLEVTPVPEPSSSLAILSVLGLTALRFRKRR